ncbi:MAG: hypothetical protein U0263_25305 [Polyangiaceae bacterium]
MRFAARMGCFLALSPFVTSVACSSGSDSGEGSSDFGVRYCALFEPCCQAAGMPTTLQSCHFLFGSAVAKDQKAAEDCIKQYETWAKEPDWCQTFSTKPRPESCKVAYPEGTSQGKKKLGEACQGASDCAGNAQGDVECHHDFDSGKDYCRLVRAAAIGEACIGTQQGSISVYEGTPPAGATEVAICKADAGAYCKQGTCAAREALGGACSGFASCAGDDTYCASTCKPKVGGGGSCSDGSDACTDDTYCPSVSNPVCTARVADGTSCGVNDECTSHYCDGTCKPNPGLGGLALFALCP